MYNSSQFVSAYRKPLSPIVQTDASTEQEGSTVVSSHVCINLVIDLTSNKSNPVLVDEYKKQYKVIEIQIKYDNIIIYNFLLVFCLSIWGFIRELCKKYALSLFYVRNAP